jgi:hypothetical protein
MTLAWYERMNRRERVLAWIVAGTVFLLFNLFLWSWLLNAIGRSRAELASRRAARAQEVLYVRERGGWEKRDQWLRQHQPTMKSAAEASTLLDQLKQNAGKYNIVVENPAIGTGETTPYHQTVFASIETKCPWPALVHFLYDVQQPESFIVFESVNLAVDSTDPTLMHGKFKIARWFAPAQRPKPPS